MLMRCIPTIDHAYEMYTYDRSCLLELLTYERHTCKRFISTRETCLPTGVYLTGVSFKACTLEVYISWAGASHRVCASHGHAHLISVYLMGVSLSRTCISKACSRRPGQSSR